MNSKRTMIRAAGALGITALLAACGTQVAEPFTPTNVNHADLNPLNAEAQEIQGMEAAHGGATLTLVGNELTVSIEADGLTPGLPHPQHIHGFTEGLAVNAVCPPMAAADDVADAEVDPNNELITLPEGAPYYGGVLIPLVDEDTLPEDFDNIPLSAWPVADDQGQIDYSRTFTLTDDQVASITPLYNKAIVLHGADLNGLDVAEGYVGTLPVACGEIGIGAVE